MCYAVIPEEHHQLNNENINPNDDSPNQRWIIQLQHCAATRTNFGEVKLELCPALQLSIECLGESLSKTGASSSLNIATKLVESLPDVRRRVCRKYQNRIEEDIWQAKLSSYTFIECQILNQARDCIHHHLSSCESPPELLNVLNQLHRNVIRDTPCDGSENANDP
ncbi:hypothetical protein pipiens_006627 [Culex pipiens pipiens]|uniref:Uncharacterized protein n=1 Tax=Culex pipiens pipiens TaxID=38569 RepID=A0ABD1DPB7_CULPP